MNQNHDIHELHDRAVSQLRSTEPDPQAVADAASRVWTRLQSDTAAVAASAAEIREINSCDDYQALIPAFLNGDLPEARKVLLEDHTRECVPCHRALKETREGKTPRRTSEARPAAKIMSFPKHVTRWALAATLVAGIGMALYFLTGAMLYSGPGAVVQSADGLLFRVTETAHLPVAVGDEISRGEVIRTGRGGGAVLRLNDGSLVEMRERSEIALEEDHSGTTIDLGRGNVIVEAAKQRKRHLFVATDDCLVTVTGTIFSVKHGTKGSRVLVVEGHVNVAFGGDETELNPGEQIATQEYLAAIPAEREIGWSRNVETYLELLAEYRELRRQIEEQVPSPALRFDTRLLDLVPEDTVLYAALPNLSETFTRTHQVIEDQLNQSPVLEQWWQEKRQLSHGFETQIDHVVDTIAEFGDFLGNELVVTAQSRVGTEGDDNFSGPLVLAEILDPAGFRAFVEEALANEGVTLDDVAFLDDPFAPAGEAAVYIWMHDDLMVGAPQLERVQQVASFLQGSANPFVGSAFHQRIAESYAEGVELLVAGDIESVVRGIQAGNKAETAHFARLGMLNAQHLMVEQKSDDKVQHQVALTFKEPRSGIASWLAEPAAIGALDFVSAEARLVGAFTLDDPQAMLADIMSFGDQDSDQVFDELEKQFGLDLRESIAEVLGGEFVFTLDGPLLPEPAWKLIIEVYDPARFQFAIEQAVAQANTHLAQEGEEPLVLSEDEVGGRTFYTVSHPKYDVHYAYVEGYFVAAPDRSLIDSAIRYRKSGYTLTESSRFVSLLPVDSKADFSGLVFQDMTSMMREAAETLADNGALTPEQEAQIDELTAEGAPTLAFVYAEDYKVTASISSQTSFTRMLVERLLGLENPMGFADVLEQLPMGGFGNI